MSSKPTYLSDSLVLFSSDDDELDSEYEFKQHKNLTAMLKGVPPPSSITISKFTIEEILQKYHENKKSFGFGLESCATVQASSKKPVPFLNYSNSSSISEIIASLTQKVQERYIQLETMSSWNICIETSLESCSSAKKRLRIGQGLGLSPSRRLSHLARRRQFFSSANLKRLASAENVRQIAIRKNIYREDIQRNISRKIESEKLKSSKRALFLSPESGTPTKYGNSIVMDRKSNLSNLDEIKKLALQERSKKVDVLKWLSQQNFEVDFPRKRLREECANHSDERKRKCPRRSLNFADDDVSSNVATSDSNNSAERKTTGSGKLSEIHKNKLLWAVSVVLRENKISQKDEHFKNIAAKLFSKCRTNLDEILSLNVAEGTSDKILYYARKILPSVLEKLGINSKLSFENGRSSEKANSNSGFEMPEDSKENINRNNIVSIDKATNSADSEVKFVFKTPKKVSRRRIAKSCQKALNTSNKRKKSILRKWRSLELLIEDAVQSSDRSSNMGGTFVGVKSISSAKDETNFHTQQSIQFFDMKNNVLDEKFEPMTSSRSYLLASNTIKNDDSINISTCVILGLPYVDTSVIFSPIPCSDKEENESILYPSLCVNQTKPEKSENLSDGNDSMEIPNQDDDLMKRIHFAENISEEYLRTYREDTPTYETNIEIEDNIAIDKSTPMLSPIENTQNVCEITQLCCPSAVNVSLEPLTLRKEIHSDEIKKEESHNIIGFSVGSKTETSEIKNSEEEEECYENDVNINDYDSSDQSNPLTENHISKVEKERYKPRKLIVKKSKPNWKVVRKNSEEMENESELRLTMRLSHEWEIIARNSSCSDIGNNSECDATSLNYSQTTNSTDKEVSSENELDSSRRSSLQSKLDNNVEEEITKSNFSFQNNDTLQINESTIKFNLDLSSSDEKSKGRVIVEKAIPTELLETDNSMLSNEVDNSIIQEKSCLITRDDLNGTLKVEIVDSNIRVIQGRLDFIKQKEARNVKNGIEVVSSAVKSKSSDEIILKDIEEVNELVHKKEEKVLANENSHFEGPSTFFVKSLSKTEKLQKNSNKETTIRKYDYMSFKRLRQLESGQIDSESGISSASDGPERKRKFLTLENYKARKLEKVSKEMKSKVFSDELALKDISPEEKSVEGHTNRKIYNIRLKQPVRHRKQEYKYKDYSKDKRKKHKNKEIYTEKSVSTGNLESQRDGSCKSDSQPVLRKFIINSCENNTPGKVELNDNVQRNTHNLETLGTSNSNPKEVNVQTIVDALTTLSNLVKEQIKLEGDKMSAQVNSSGNGLKKSKWLEVVSSWCGKNLNSLNLTPNASSLSVSDSDDINSVASKEELKLSSLPKTMSNISNYRSIDDKINNLTDCLKTDQKPIKDIVKPFPSVRRNTSLNSLHDMANLTKIYLDSSQNSEISNGVRLDYNCHIENFQNYPVYSGSSSINGATSFNLPEDFNRVLEFSAGNEYRLSGVNMGLNSESEMSRKHFSTNQKQTMNDPCHKINYWSKSLLPRETSTNTLEWMGGIKSISTDTSNYREHSSSVQSSYQINSNYPTSHKASFYQPNLYENCSSWQIPNDMSSMNYNQNSMRDRYQSSAFYPYQISNIPYHFNNY